MSGSFQIVLYNFHRYDRIDIVFDSSESKTVKSHISRHGLNTNLPEYDLKCDDVLDSTYQKLVHNNRAIVAARVRECWSNQACIQMIPEGKTFVVAGPIDTAIVLKRNHQPQEDYLLLSNHIEADTRILLHAQAVSFENVRSIVIQANDTDVILLSIAHALSLDIDNLIVKSMNPKAKTDTYINVYRIAEGLQKKYTIDPLILLVAHALSGCDTTSFIKNITKMNFFRTFFTATDRYLKLDDFFQLPLSSKFELALSLYPISIHSDDALVAAERLLIDCYPSSNIGSFSLDELRASIAMSAFKQNRISAIASHLPPTSNAFYHHCVRAAHQIQIWSQALKADMVIQPIENCDGFHMENHRVQLKWISVDKLPTDPRLSVCGKCSTNCRRCYCGKNGFVCTMVCKCSHDRCENREKRTDSNVSDLVKTTWYLCSFLDDTARSFHKHVEGVHRLWRWRQNEYFPRQFNF
jgi:hypothetical protein